MVVEERPAAARILVIGSAGFIGTHLTARLAEQGYVVHGMDLRTPTEDFGCARFVRGDVRRREDLVAAMRETDTVINLAAVHFDFGHEAQEYFDTNETGMQTLLDAMTEAGIQRLVFTSSIAVYGDRDDWADEQTPPHPSAPYGASKLAAEKRVCQWVAEDPQRAVAIVRPCAVYGERNVSNMMNLIRQIHSGFFILFGSGENVKATAYVGNLVDALIMQLRELSPGVTLYNYADKPDLTVNQIVRIIRQALGKKPEPLRLPVWLGVLAAVPFDLITRVTGKNLPVSSARVRKLAQPTKVHADRIREAGFQQQVDSAEGLQRMVRHYLAHHDGLTPRQPAR